MPVDPTFASKFKIKRAGKDKDDLFWAFGKVHGIENIAFLSAEDIVATGGDPMKIQHLVDQINDAEKPLPPVNHDTLVATLNDDLDLLKDTVERIDAKQEINASDKKKLLTMPFFL